jgi:hypothetical protein
MGVQGLITIHFLPVFIQLLYLKKIQLLVQNFKSEIKPVILRAFKQIPEKIILIKIKFIFPYFWGCSVSYINHAKHFDFCSIPYLGYKYVKIYLKSALPQIRKKL